MGINKIEFGIYLGTTYSVIAKVDVVELQLFQTKQTIRTSSTLQFI